MARLVGQDGGTAREDIRVVDVCDGTQERRDADILDRTRGRYHDIDAGEHTGVVKVTGDFFQVQLCKELPESDAVGLLVEPDDGQLLYGDVRILEARSGIVGRLKRGNHLLIESGLESLEKLRESWRRRIVRQRLPICEMATYGRRSW